HVRAPPPPGPSQDRGGLGHAGQRRGDLDDHRHAVSGGSAQLGETAGSRRPRDLDAHGRDAAGPAIARGHEGRPDLPSGHEPMIATAASATPGPAELAPPALGVPVPALVGLVLRDHHQVPDARADLVVAARATVGLVAAHPANVEPRAQGPGRPRRLRHPGRLDRLRGTAVLPRHQPAPATRSTKGTASPARVSPTSRASRLRPLTLNEWSPPSIGTCSAARPSLRRTFRTTSGLASGSAVPWMNSMGTAIRYRWSSRTRSGLPGGWNG